jgi:hypothetical protein
MELPDTEGYVMRRITTNIKYAAYRVLLYVLVRCEDKGKIMTDKTIRIFNGIKELCLALNVAPSEVIDLLEEREYLTDDDVFLIELYFHNDSDPEKIVSKDIKSWLEERVRIGSSTKAKELLEYVNFLELEIECKRINTVNDCDPSVFHEKLINT